MKFTHAIQTGYVELKFEGKPDADIRNMLKAAGFRWSPSALAWWRSKVAGAGDFITALDRRLNPGRPDGDCWCCKIEPGFFRPMGAASPVFCDACYAEVLRQERERQGAGRHHEDPIDRQYEDDCYARTR